jgi:hypothetical protein
MGLQFSAWDQENFDGLMAYALQHKDDLAWLATRQLDFSIGMAQLVDAMS